MSICKKIISGAVLFLISALMFAQTAIQPPFSKGLNLSKWFETWDGTIPNLKTYDKTDFEHLKELGVEVVRIPVHFASFCDDEDGTINPKIFEYLDKACDWAESLGMYIIIDNHSFNSGKYPSPDQVQESLFNVWPQIAKHYKNRSKYIVYEILNEPQFKNVSWEPIQAETLNLIRKTDKKHTVILTGADWSSLNSMCALTPLKDKNIIYTFHYYEPYVFTHQGADWADKGIAALHDIPFPYDKNRMPEVPEAAKTSYVAGNLKNNYPKDGTVEAMKNQLSKAVEFSKKANAPVWCGELGVYDLVSPEKDRNFWYKAVGDIMNEYKIAYTVWGYDDSFGIFQPKTLKQYPRDLNVEVLKSLRFNVPEGAGDMSIPDKSALPLQIYDDAPGKGISLVSYNMNFFNTNYTKDKYEGNACIMTGWIDHYGAFSADMSKINLADLAEKKNNAYLCFMVKFTKASEEFQVRFVDTDDGTGEKPPYRLSYDVCAKNYPLNEWVPVEIKIGSMNDYGGWSNILNKWYDSNGKFAYNRIEKLEFSAEKEGIRDLFYIDDIKIILK